MPSTTAKSIAGLRGAAGVQRRRINISAKRQITIPQKFYEQLGFTTEAECILRGSELVIRPVRNDGSGAFAEQILADLIAQGYEGPTLLSKFKEEQQKVRPAVEAMLADAAEAAAGRRPSETYEDVFGTEE